MGAVPANSGSWRPIRRFSRPSTASAWSEPRAKPPARVIKRVSSPTLLRAKPLFTPEPLGTPAPGPADRVRRMNGRRSISGNTRCWISQRLVSW